jgi:hypothetical protein
MQNSNVTKDDLKRQIEHLFGSWIEVDFNYLKQLFGFKRVSGVTMAVTKLVSSSKTEAELSIDLDHIYRFRCSANRDRILSIITSKIQDQDREFHKRPRMVVLHFKIARSFYDQQIFNNVSYSSSLSPDGKFKILGMDVIEAINVEKDYVELIY